MSRLALARRGAADARRDCRPGPYRDRRAGGFAHGFAHPLGGLDHVLAMVAVGLFAAHLGGRALVAGAAVVRLDDGCRRRFRNGGDRAAALSRSGSACPSSSSGSRSPFGCTPDRGRDGAGRLFALFPRPRARRRDAGIGLGSRIRGRFRAGDRAAARARDRDRASALAGRARRSGDARCRPPEARWPWPGIALVARLIL